MKKVILGVIIALTAIGGGFLVCCDKPEREIVYQVTQEEYENAFSLEKLSNITIAMKGPYWERDGAIEYFYNDGDNFIRQRYKEDKLDYGEYYGLENGKEFCYLYDGALTQNSYAISSWYEYHKPFEYSDRGVQFVTFYQREYSLLEYDEQTNCYRYINTAYGEKIEYTYHFEDKVLKKFEIKGEKDEEYHYIWEFYNYGTTKLPVDIDKDQAFRSALIRKYQSQYPNAGKTDVLCAYGKYNGVGVAMMVSEDEGYAAVEWSETIDEYEIKYADGNRILAFAKDGIYTLTEAYGRNYLSSKDIADIAYIQSVNNDHLYDAQTRISLALSSKYDESVEVVQYYGEYGKGGVIVAKMDLVLEFIGAEWIEDITDKYMIHYEDERRIWAFYNGEVYTLTEAYENGILTEEDIKAIYLKDVDFYPWMYFVSPMPEVYLSIEFNAQYESTMTWREDTAYPFVRIIRSFDEFTTYCAQKGITHVSYDESYFEDKYLLLVVTETPGSGITYMVSDVWYGYPMYTEGYLVILKEPEDETDGGPTVSEERHCFIELNNSVVIKDESCVQVRIKE